jgi:hypothetical protein
MKVVFILGDGLLDLVLNVCCLCSVHLTIPHLRPGSIYEGQRDTVYSVLKLSPSAAQIGLLLPWRARLRGPSRVP